MDLLNYFLKLADILNLDLSSEEAFAYIKNIFETELGFDFVLIGYLQYDGIEIKTMSEVNENIKFVQSDVLGKYFKKFLEKKKSIVSKITVGKEGILDEVGVSIKKNASAILLPLKIKDAVFGIILGIKFGQDLISQEVFAIAQGYASVASYLIKDAELSNVFKLQTKILNDNVIDKTNALNDIKEQNEKIQQSEKLKTDFLMNMSHSLRTPLNAIIVSSEALEMNVFGKLNDKQKEYILDIQNSGKEMLGLVNDILDMSKIEAGAMKLIKKEVDICLLITEAVNIIKSLADKKNIKIIKNIPKNSVIVACDAQKINQVLYNLLSNAIKFTSNKGKIEIGLSERKNKVQIFVKDNGVGIDKKYQGKIFGKFEQVENDFSQKYASTGLGLTITKELVELHDGKIWLESIVNEGTTFTIELPMK